MKPLVFVCIWILAMPVFFSSNGNETGHGFVNNIRRSQKLDSLLAENSIQSGDIVFRLGYGFISESMQKLSLKDPRYSHAGLISIEGGKPVVYHLIGGESSASVILREPLKNFCSADNAVSFAVYRTSLDEAFKKSIDSLNRFYFSVKLPYDSRFDLATDSTMYCTEYVYKVLSKAAGKDILISSSMLTGQPYIACDDIYLNPVMKKIFSFNYE